MKFNPKSRQQIQEEFLLTPGNYKLEVIKADDKQDKNNNDMLELYLKTTNSFGREVTLRDWLTVFKMSKLLSFCEVTGLSDQYKNGDLLASDCIGKSLWAKVGIQKGNPKNDGSGEDWPSKNNVIAYLGENEISQAQKSEAFIEDSIPF